MQLYKIKNHHPIFQLVNRNLQGHLSNLHKSVLHYPQSHIKIISKEIMKKSQGNIIYHFLLISQRMSQKKKISVILNLKQNRNLKLRLKTIIFKKVKVLQNNLKKVSSAGTIHKNNGRNNLYCQVVINIRQNF